MIPDAVMVHGRDKRNDQEFATQGMITKFSFTPPGADLDGLDPSYFAPMDQSTIDQRLAKLAALKDQELKMEARAVAFPGCQGEVKVHKKYTKDVS